MSGGEDDTHGGDKDAAPNGDDTDTTPPLARVERTLESITASKIDQLHHDIQLLSKSV